MKSSGNAPMPWRKPGRPLPLRLSNTCHAWRKAFCTRSLLPLAPMSYDRNARYGGWRCTVMSYFVRSQVTTWRPSPSVLRGNLRAAGGCFSLVSLYICITYNLLYSLQWLKKTVLTCWLFSASWPVKQLLYFGLIQRGSRDGFYRGWTGHDVNINYV